ncbi:PKD domain-containing protein [Nocardioides zhouii]|uniref:PKD domain-containing protein n=1 Tax=Nocardioides zhouii TaxID=1168729 RepID=A0A4Q2SL07_9ACTN|nr:hypothetical protein [Nocardioides zhouii]RYC05853.1 hypothetical protein EUA94_16475 [Nocardioides zhouii]
MRRLAKATCVALVASLTIIVGPPALAQCGVQAEVGEVVEECVDRSAAQVEEMKALYPTSTWTVRQLCKDDSRTPEGVCFNPQECTTAAGVPGTRYTLYRDGEVVGTACLTADEEAKIGDPPPIRVLVLKAFEILDWPASELVVQPPGGRTLVNLDTNFYTTNTDLTNIAVTLVRSDVVISARPIAYRWHFGDGTTVTTTSPGAPYPDLDVSHVYERTDQVTVSVDTQYGDASFTVGGGAPEQIPSTIWINGAESDLAIVEALPQLVLR